MYEWCSMSRWYEDECSDDLYDVDFEEENSLPEMTKFTPRDNSHVNSLSDSWSDIMAMIALNLNEDLAKVEEVKQKEKFKSLSVTKGIPDSGLESEGEACSAPSVMVGPPPMKKEAKLRCGDDQIVFTSLTKESNNSAEEVSDTTCNLEDSADPGSLTVKLSPFPNVGCRITLTGDTILSF